MQCELWNKSTFTCNSNIIFTTRLIIFIILITNIVLYLTDSTLPLLLPLVGLLVAFIFFFFPRFGLSRHSKSASCSSPLSPFFSNKLFFFRFFPIIIHAFRRQQNKATWRSDSRTTTNRGLVHSLRFARCVRQHFSSTLAFNHRTPVSTSLFSLSTSLPSSLARSLLYFPSLFKTHLFDRPSTPCHFASSTLCNFDATHLSSHL